MVVLLSSCSCGLWNPIPRHVNHLPTQSRRLLRYPRLQRCFGTLPVARAGLLFAACIAAVIPLPSLMPERYTGYEAAASAMLAASLALKAVAQVRGAAWLTAAMSGFKAPASCCAVQRHLCFCSSHRLSTRARHRDTHAHHSTCLRACSPAHARPAPPQCCAFTGAMILVNTSSPASQLGAVNGAGQTLASLVRGLGPLLGGVVWGAALRVARGQFLVFAMAAGVALGAALLFTFLRPAEAEAEEVGGLAKGAAKHKEACCEA